MRNKILAVILFVGLSAIFSNINAQQLVIRVEKPFVAKSLLGLLTDENGGKIPIGKTKLNLSKQTLTANLILRDYRQEFII